MTDHRRPRRPARVAPVGAVAAVAALALGPVLLNRGFVLVGDMTFVPVQPWSGAWLGLDGSVPRAVPADAIVSVLTHVVPGDLLQKTILLGALVLAALGTIRLVRGFTSSEAMLAPLAAGVLYLWNPWVLERLAIGHWGLLVGYAAMPWLVGAALAVRGGEPRLPGLVLAAAVAAFSSPTGGVTALLVVLVLLVGAVPARVLAGAAGTVLLVNLPWVLPGLLGDPVPADPGGVAAFAARSDSPWGIVGSLLSFGGIWKRSIVPGERDSVLLVGLAVALTLVALAVLVLRARRGPDRGVFGRLLLLGLVGFLLAALPATGAGADLSRSLVEHLPGAGILRDSQKWLLLLVLPVSAGVGLAVDLARRRLPALGLGVRVVPVAAVLMPLVLLPSLAWGVAGRLEPVRYPGEWQQVRDVLADRPAADRRTVVLPWSAYQRHRWNGDRAALEPAIRYFPGEVVTNDVLVLNGHARVAGEDRAAARIGAAIAAGSDLGPVLERAGIRYVLVEKAVPGVVPPLGTATEVLHDGAELTLLDLGHGTGTPRLAGAWFVVAGDLVAFGAALVALGFLILRRLRPKSSLIR